MNESYARLWAAVVSQAIADLDSRYPGDRAAAIRWIYGRRTNSGSFLWVCDHLDLDFRRLQTLCMTREGRKTLVRKNGNRKGRKLKRVNEDET